MATHIWTTLTQDNTPYDADINKRAIGGARNHLASGKLLMTKLGNRININRPYYKSSVTVLDGQWQEIAEGIEERPTMNPRDVVNMQVRVKLYGAAIVVSKQRMNDEGYGYIQKLVPTMTERALERMEVDFYNMIMNVNPTTYDPYRDQRDGVSLYNVAHGAGVNGATYGNTPASGSPLSETSLSQAITYYMSIRNDAGDLAPWMGNKFVLVVHPSRYLYAQQLVKSLSSTADAKNSGVINPVSRANGLEIEVVPGLYQVSTTAWLLAAVGDNEDGGADIVVRDAPGAPVKNVKYNPDQIQWLSDMRYTLYVSDPRKFYYNPGV